MANIILRPLAIGSLDAWALGAGASKMLAVDTGDPVAHDDDTTYISNNETNNSQSFTLTPVPAGMATVDAVSLGSRAKTSIAAGNSMDDRLILGASNVAVNAYALAGVAYVTMGPTASARPGGGTWTPADILTLEMGIRASAGAPCTFVCTSLWVSLDFTFAGGGFSFLINSLIPLLLGSNILLSDMPRIAREVERRGEVRIAQSEYLQAWQELRAPKRVFFLPGRG